MSNLAPFLRQMLIQVDDSAVENDPIGIAREYDLPEDRELVAMVASALAYGQVKVMRAAIRDAMARFGPMPSQTLRGLSAEQISEHLQGWYYRMTKAADLTDLLVAVMAVRQEYGGLEDAYLASDGTHVERASAWVALIRAHRHRPELTRGFSYLLGDPGLGGATKRLHLFFRWVVRPDDGVDLGLWTRVERSDLLMPLDTHTARICRYLGLTKRNANDLKAVLEISEALREIAPDDPMMFDFALCHLGISKGCIHRRSERHCPNCPINAVCALPWD